MNLVGSFYQRFLLFAESVMLVRFKLDEQIFFDPGVDLLFEGGRTYGQSVSYDIHERII